MFIHDLPSFVRHSTVFSPEELAQLCQLEAVPSDEEVDQIRAMPMIQELTNAFIGDETTRNVHLQLKAKDYLASNEVYMAWCVLLL